MKRAKKPAKAQRTYQARLTDPDGSLDGVLGAVDRQGAQRVIATLQAADSTRFEA